MGQRILLGIVAAVAVALGALAVFVLTEEPAGSPATISTSGADIGGPFTLTDHTGQQVSLADLTQSAPAVLYFGYTFCPDVCPVDAATLSHAVDMLEERGHTVTPVFVSVDPERDTPEALAPFVEAMHPRMVGLTGTEDEIRAAAKAWRVFYERGPGEGADYLMSHSNFFYLVRDGELVAMFRPGFPPEEIARAIEQAL